MTPEKLDGQRQMAVDYRKLNKVTISAAAAVLTAVDALEWIDRGSGAWYTVQDSVNTFSKAQ